MDKIKSALHRTTQTVNQKLGKADSTVDEEYDTLHRTFANSFTLSENFNKHVQQLVENVNALTAIMTFVSEDLTEIYLHSDDPNKKRMTEEIMAVSIELEKSGVQPFQQQIMANVYTQVAEYVARFDDVKKLHKQRNDLVKEYDYFRNRVQKMSETSQKDPLALPKEKEKMRKAKEDMDTVANLTKEKMRELVDMKPIVFAGVTEQFIGSFIQYTDQAKSSFNKLQVHSAAPLAGSARSPQAETTVVKKTSPVPPQATGSRVPPKFDCEWHYLDSGVNQQGPFNFQQMKAKYQKGEINANTHVFGGDMSDWQTIGAVPDLGRALSA